VIKKKIDVMIVIRDVEMILIADETEIAAHFQQERPYIVHHACL